MNCSLHNRFIYSNILSLWKDNNSMCALATCLDAYVYTSVWSFFFVQIGFHLPVKVVKECPGEGGVPSVQRTALPCRGVLALSPRFQGYGSQFSLNTDKADSEHTEQNDSARFTTWQRRVSFFPVPLSQSTSPLCLTGNTSELLPYALLLKR